MARFLIEVPHKKAKRECQRAIDTFKRSGSHFLTNADWGCADDVHKAWISIELDSKEEALMIVPPAYRKKAKVITLKKFAFDKPDEGMDLH
jgi:hypothetical protein